MAKLLTKAAAPLNAEESPPRMTIVSDSRTNSIIITAPPSLVDQWANAITELDNAPPAELGAPLHTLLCDTTRLELLVACIQGDHKRLLSLDAKPLEAKATTVESFIESLREFGEVRILATASQVFDLSDGANITRGMKIPYVRIRGTNEAGQPYAAVNHENTRVQINVQGTWSAEHAGLGRHLANIQLSYMTDSGILTSESVTAPMFHSVHLESRSEMTSGKPVILYASNTSDTDDGASAVICRLVLTRTPPIDCPGPVDQTKGPHAGAHGPSFYLGCGSRRNP